MTLDLCRELQAAFGSLMNSQKVVLHPINDGHSVMEACPEEDEEVHLDQEETERRQSLLASTGSSLIPARLLDHLLQCCYGKLYSNFLSTSNSAHPTL